MFTINYNHAIIVPVTKVTIWSPILTILIFFFCYQTQDTLIQCDLYIMNNNEK